MKANVLEQGQDAFAVHSNAGKSTQPAQREAGKSTRLAQANNAAE
jgi:hypothetical protein